MNAFPDNPVWAAVMLRAIVDELRDMFDGSEEDGLSIWDDLFEYREQTVERCRRVAQVIFDKAYLASAFPGTINFSLWDITEPIWQEFKDERTFEVASKIAARLGVEINDFML